MWQEAKLTALSDQALDALASELEHSTSGTPFHGVEHSNGSKENEIPSGVLVALS